MYREFAEISMGKRINLLYRLSMMNLRNEMKKLGVGVGDYAFIAFLFINEDVSQDELSRMMRVDKSYTARALARLEKLGLVERKPDPDEHRIKRVVLSEKARKMEQYFFAILKG